MKKLTSVLLTAISALLLLQSCSSGTDTSGSDTTADDVQTETTAAAETTTIPLYTAPEVDYDGKEFDFYTYRASQLKPTFFTDNYDGIYTESETGDVLNDAIYKRNRTVEEQLGVVIKNTEWTTGSPAIVNLVLSGDDVYDAALASHSQMSNCIVTGGILYDLNDIDTLDIDMPWWDPNANHEYEIGGRLYTTTGDLCLFNTAAIGCLYFNRPMVEQFSLDNPYQLVYDGKWTLENFEKLCKAVSADLNGNGEVDVEDRFGLSGSKTVIKMLQEASGIRDATKNADGISEISLNHPNMQTLLETAVRILRDKATTLYVGDFPEDVTYTVFLPAFVDNRLLFHFNWVFMSFELRDMEADFGMLPFPKFDEAQENHYSYDATGYQTFLIMPITNSVPEMTGHVLNAMGYYSKELMTPAFIETSVTDKIMRDDDSAKMLEILNNNRVFEMYDMFKWGNIGALTGTLLDSKSTDFASAYAAAIEKANTELAKTYSTFDNK